MNRNMLQQTFQNKVLMWFMASSYTFVYVHHKVMSHLQNNYRIYLTPFLGIRKPTSPLFVSVSLTCCGPKWLRMAPHIWTLSSSSSFSFLALVPFRFVLVFPNDIFPFRSAQNSRFSSFYCHIPQVKIVFIYAPSSRSSAFFSLLLLCLQVTSLLSLYHPFIQYTQAIPIHSL